MAYADLKTEIITALLSFHEDGSITEAIPDLIEHLWRIIQMDFCWLNNC